MANVHHALLGHGVLHLQSCCDGGLLVFTGRGVNQRCWHGMASDRFLKLLQMCILCLSLNRMPIDQYVTMQACLLSQGP